MNSSQLLQSLPTVDLHTLSGVAKIDKFSKLPLSIVEEHFSTSINKTMFCDVSGCRYQTDINSYRFCHVHKFEYCQTCMCQPSEESKVFNNPLFKDFHLCYRCICLILHCGITDEHRLLKDYLKNVRVVVNDVKVEDIN